MTTGASSVDVTDRVPAAVVDAVVIGGGAAGLSAALMLGRSRRTVIVIDSASPRNAPAAGVHGLLGLEGIAPAELYRRGREEVRHYGGLVVDGEVASAASAAPSAGGDLRFVVVLTDGRRVRSRRLVVATGLRDRLPDVPGLAEHWGRGVVHCPYCHGWEVRGEPIGILAVGAASVHQAMLFRQLSDDVVYFTRHSDLDEATRAQFAARQIVVVDTPVAQVVQGGDGGIAGVRLTDGQVVDRRVLAVATIVHARTEGFDGLSLPMEDLPAGMGRRIASGLAGTTAVPGVWVAGNATDAYAQVGAAAAAGALAGARVNAHLAAADTGAAVALAGRAVVPTSQPVDA